MKQLKLSNQCNHDTLINFGFKKYGMNYKMLIPLYWNDNETNETLIELEILISCVDNYIGYDVIDKCNDTLYMAYYDKEGYGNSDVLKTVERNIEYLFKKMSDKNIITKRCLGIA